MDKHSVIGLVLMGLVIALFTWLGRPSSEELALQQRYNDSIATINHAATVKAEEERQHTTPIIPSSTERLSPEQKDSLLQAESYRLYGEFSTAATQGTEELITLKSDSVAYTISTKGGVLVSSELAFHKNYTGEPIQLIREKEAQIGFSFITRSNRVIQSNNLFFKPSQISPTELLLTATSNNGASLNLKYTLKNKYLLTLDIFGSEDFKTTLAPNTSLLDTSFEVPIYQNEKSAKSEQNYSGITYQFSNGDVESLSTRKDLTETPSGTLKWIAFRDMFFSTIVYSPKGLERVSMEQKVLPEKDKSGRLKELKSKFALSLENATEQMPLQLVLYTGPNDYTLLDQIDKQLQDGTEFSRVVDMGSWFRFINTWLIAPLFNFLEKFFHNYGIIILLMTLLIKLFLSPFTYKAFKSQARMKVLRPLVNEINEQYPGTENMAKRQQKTMELYQSAGVNTLGGCLPMLLQMPFLIAMYQYFPTSINLRGESFLWAQDLSTYDDVIRWGFDIPFIGEHLSIFCLLMTITQIFYMKITQANSGGDPQQAKMMKWMTYVMAIMLFSFLNNNSSGLSYYYFLSMLISIIQTQIFQWTLDEKKVLAELEENRKKPRKKSRWLQRLEEAQKEQMKRRNK